MMSNDDKAGAFLDELCQLAHALGIEPMSVVFQVDGEPEPRTALVNEWKTGVLEHDELFDLEEEATLR